MEDIKVNSVQRDYDKEPIVINNNFTSITFGITFWLMFNGLIIYLVFFGDAIDWSQNKDWITILKNEMSKSVRFGGVVVGFVVTNLLAFRSLYKNLKKPRKIILTNEYIKGDKSFNDLEFLETKDVLYINRGFFPLLLTGYTKYNFLSVIGLTVASIFVILCSLISFFIKVIIYRYYESHNFIILFSKKTNRVININLISQDKYLELKKYFLNILKLNIDEAQFTFKLSNIIGEDNAR